MTEPMDKTIIQVENLTAGYGDHVILRDVSFRIGEGEILAIAGGSGCGKTTLLKYLFGLYQAQQGRVMVHGVDLTTADDDMLNRQRLGLGVLFQSGALIGSLTLGENIALPLSEHTDLDDDFVTDLVRMKLGMVHLAGYENHFPAELSGGMKKRAGLARAMAMDPTILFFDEPSAGLDPVTSAELYTLIDHLNRDLGTTMVIVTHDLDLIFGIVHRVILLDGAAQGIIADGKPAELQQRHANAKVRQFFQRRA